MFRLMKPGGFHITFPNGLTLSTQIHDMAYCDNHSMDIISPYLNNVGIESMECQNAEVGILKNNELITDQCPCCDGNDYICGYVDMDKWLQILDWCRNYGIKDEFNESV